MNVAYELLFVGRICHLVVLPSSFTVATESGGLVKYLVVYFWLILEVLVLAARLICKRTLGTRLTIFAYSLTLLFQHLEKAFLFVIPR